ncbi:TetR/AcrR family transcriptional regulator [Nocardia sp. 348MFTsu5.1]|uniref:TetR/AcrR family transcriptional regulator n=1 Tax=Nocardia sp. 348MFTsu5.1 TaxID=1172185 RepID=UPI0003642E1B|nr:TetR/AcrR family transcriptional regulator [Nocardia sp. 348MFTsu5.1]
MRSRNKILDATIGLIAVEGFDRVNIAAVAAAAGVSRQTVYSIFGTREDLVSQAVSGLTVEILGDIRSRLENVDTPVDYLVELIVAGRATVKGHPALAALLHAEVGNPIFDTGMISRAKPIARELLRPLIDRHPETTEHIDDIIAMGLRIGLSTVLFDDADIAEDNDLREFLTRWLAPAMHNWTRSPKIS